MTMCMCMRMCMCIWGAHDKRVDGDHDDDDEEGVGDAWDSRGDHHDDPIESLDSFEQSEDAEGTQASKKLQWSLELRPTVRVRVRVEVRVRVRGER